MPARALRNRLGVGFFSGLLVMSGIALLPARLGAAGHGSCACPWAGIYPTVVTPFCCGGGVDVASLEKQIHYQLTGGVNGLLVLGTIGEGQYATMDERAQVITTAVHATCGHVPVVVGIHTCDLAFALAQMEQARDLGAAAVLVKYVGNPQASCGIVLGFFACLCDAHLLPIFYYHYPSQTGLQLASQEIASILALDGVVGIKESTLNLREVQAHMRLMCGLGKTFLSGTALNLTQFMDLGGHGAMCPEALLLPGPTEQAYQAFRHGRCDEARAIQVELFQITPILRSGPGSPRVSRALLMAAEDHRLPVPMGHDEPQARLKFALNCLGIPTPTMVKCPLPGITPHEKERVRTAVCKLKAIDWCEIAMNAPPVPLHTGPEHEAGGMLLRTGAFQLGPNVGRDLLRSQGDGQSGN